MFNDSDSVSDIVYEFQYSYDELKAAKQRVVEVAEAFARVLRLAGKPIVHNDQLYFLGPDDLVHSQVVLNTYGLKVSDIKVSDLIPPTAAPTVEDAEFGPRHGDRVELAAAHAADATAAFIEQIDTEVA